MKPPTAQQMHTASDGATNIEMTWDEDVAHNKRQTDSEGWNAFDRTSMIFRRYLKLQEGYN